MPTIRPLEPKQWFSENLDEHMALIQRQVDRSIRGGETRQLAVKIVSGAYDRARDPRTGDEINVVKAFGHKFRAPESGIGIAMKDEQSEMIAIWDFTILNSRYVYDPPTIDTFATVEKTLEAGGGDCFPEGTVMVRRNPQTKQLSRVAVQDIRVGDFVSDGNSYVEVLKTWVRGPKEIYRAQLYNGRVLRLSDQHRVIVVDRDGEHERRMCELRRGDRLRQPRGETTAVTTELLLEPEQVSSYDIMTASGRVYLPESDVVTLQCDDQTILLGALLKSIGFFCKARVISTHDAPEEWVHVYALCGMPKDNPRKWIPLDPTFEGATPGWQYGDIAKYVDYDL